jgi:predicted nucleotidyltransferase
MPKILADKPTAEQLKLLARNFGLRLIVLFGSTAPGVRNRESDIDLGVLLEKPLTPVRKQRLWSALSALFPADVDLTILNHADRLVSYQITSEGVILFESVANAWEIWKSYAIRRYWDTHKFRERQSVYLARRAEELRNATIE